MNQDKKWTFTELEKLTPIVKRLYESLDEKLLPYLHGIMIDVDQGKNMPFFVIAVLELPPDISQIETFEGYRVVYQIRPRAHLA